MTIKQCRCWRVYVFLHSFARRHVSKDYKSMYLTQVLSIKILLFTYLKMQHKKLKSS